MEKRNVFIIWLVCILVNVKSAFTDYVLDTGYAFTLGYRRILGDNLFGYMREPHQTSAFFISFLMRVYSFFMPDFTGIVIVANICSIIIYAITAYLLVRLLSEYITWVDANILGAFFFILRPKIIQTFEYSNMVVVFSTLLFVSLSYHFLNQKEKRKSESGLIKYRYIYCAALCICLSVLSYPSTLMLYFATIMLLLAFDDEKWASIIRLTAFCTLFGLAYFIYILDGRKISEFIRVLFEIFNNDSHSVGDIYTGMYYWIGIIIAMGLLIISGIVAFLTSLLARRKESKSVIFISVFPVAYTVLILIEKIILITYGDYYQIGSWNVQFAFILMPIAIGLFFYRKQIHEEKIVFITGVCTGIVIIISVIILTNLSLNTVLGYGGLVAIVSCIPILKYYGKNARIITICMLTVTILSSIITDYHSLNYIRKGPLKYIVAPIEQCNMYKISYDEWNNNVTSEDIVFIPQTFGFDATFYMYTKAGVGAASTISTPYHGKLLEQYWKDFPEKEPTVMAVFAWDGLERMDVPEWLVNKIYNEYEISSSEEYWNFYRKR